MKTHSYLYDAVLAESAQAELAAENLAPGEPKPNLWLWIGVLLGVTLLVAVESELLVDSLSVCYISTRFNSTVYRGDFITKLLVMLPNTRQQSV